MSYESPISILVNEDGNIVARSGSQPITSEQPGLPIMGKDASGNAQFLNLAADGALKVSASVDIDLDASTDSVSIYNSDGNAFSLTNYLPVGLSNGTNLIGDSDATPVYVTGSSLTALHGALMMVSGGVDDTVKCLDYVENAVTEVSGAVVDLKSVIESVDSSVQSVSGAIDNLGLSVNSVNSSVGDVNLSVQAVSGAIDSLGGGLSLVDLNSSLGDINTSVGDVNLSVQAVSGALAELINNTLVDSATVSSMLAADGPDSVAPLASRKGFIFFMEGNNTAYVKFGAGASSSDYSVTVIGPGGFYELSSLRYTGELSVAFKNATGVLRITELAWF